MKPNSTSIPTGRFVIGGPVGDAGLTGRKIIVDTYGGAAPHGGGAFSGKDPTKVDRSAAYAARYLAKNVVAAGLAARCTIQVAYAIGIAKPLSVYVETSGTGQVDEDKLSRVLQELMDLSPRGIRTHLALNKPIYAPTSSYGHFGRAPEADGGFSWERLDLVDELRRSLLSAIPADGPRRRVSSMAAAAAASCASGQQALRETLLPRPGLRRSPPDGHARSARACSPIRPMPSGSRSASAAASISRRRRRRIPASASSAAKCSRTASPSCWSSCSAAGLANIRVFADDARPAARGAGRRRSIARAFILFPDPWPKERHKKRRIVSPATLDALAPTP